ncbi:hypothetical protein ACJDU8_10700 [Clostridium sp. WILCCON 0269]|uniref:Uncharacterized protein n=1 Tax=Candidatus Clostridium eludens TaxID=3381663 RepID=A0ABW8SJ20_9CLOT
MGTPINDQNLINLLLGKKIQGIIQNELEKVKFNDKDELPHPLCKYIMDKLREMKPKKENTNIQYESGKDIEKIWNNLIVSSIKCLRFFDEREPFRGDGDEMPDKIPIAYGSDNLKKYNEKYTSFESVLYGGSKYYRDHVFHSFRTWLLGIVCILNEWKLGKKPFIYSIKIDGEKEESVFNRKINFFEKISMWTIVAACHDLGYPLEKTKDIFEKTQDMMKEFIYEPRIWNNFNFSGIQDSINDYILNFMCTKMKMGEEVKEKIKEENKESGKIEEVEIINNYYNGRKQPKYYFKYAKSLEGYNHGILSAIIVYKTLTYFKEADFNLNEDYEYNEEEAKQFYIRREILRAMSSHTCSDIYNVDLSTFSSLLFICDELQEWGRKSWPDMYKGMEGNETQLTINKFSTENIVVDEVIDMKSVSNEEIKNKMKRIYTNQYENYKIIFRDGQDSGNRKYGFCKKATINLNNGGDGQERSIIIEYGVGNVNMNEFKVTYKGDDIINKEILDLKQELADSIYGGITIQDGKSDKERLEYQRSLLEDKIRKMEREKEKLDEKIAAAK